MSKMQRDKGARFEREVRKLFEEAMPGATCKRGLQCRGGDEVPDVDAGGVFSIECKVGKNPPVKPALAQILRDAPEGTIPMCVIKEDRKDAFVVLPLDDFLEFITEWYRETNRP